MTSNLGGSDYRLCLKYIKDIAQVNINILKAEIENPTKNVNLQNIKIKYNRTDLH